MGPVRNWPGRRWSAAGCTAATGCGAASGWLVRAFYWTDDRATLAYDVWVIAILAFVWLTPPDWLADPTAAGGLGLIQWLLGR